MKKLIFAIIVLLSLPLSAQILNYNAPDCIRGFSFSVSSGTISSINSQSAGRSLFYDNRSITVNQGGACTNWHMVYYTNGITAVSIEIDQAPDNGVQPGSWTVWPAAGVIGTLPLTTLNMSQVTVFGFSPWVSANVNSATGTGTVQGVLYGWRAQGSSDTTSGASQVQGAKATGQAAAGINPVLVAGSDGTNQRNIATDSSGRIILGASSQTIGAISNLPTTVSTNSSTADASTIRVVPATNQAFPTSTGSPSTSNAAGGIQDTAGVGRALASRIFPSSNASDAIGPSVNTSVGSALVLKASAGNLYDAYANSTVAGLLMVFDATSAPVDGAVTPKHCIPVAANGIGSLTFNSGPPESYATGITLVFSSGTNCFSKTASATAFLHGRVQ